MNKFEKELKKVLGIPDLGLWKNIFVHRVEIAERKNSFESYYIIVCGFEKALYACNLNHN